MQGTIARSEGLLLGGKRIADPDAPFGEPVAVGGVGISMLGILSLALCCGSRVLVTAEGPFAVPLMDKLAEMFESGFAEEEDY